jgi:tRNA pseudouridine38-40 synthase
MPRFKLTVEYDGAAYSGWQRQENGASIQQAIEQALFAFTGERAVVHGAGRTDAGVHASGQVAHVDLDKPWVGWRLREAVNAHLVEHRIAVVEAEEAADDFDARHSAVGRRYLYRLANRRAPPTFDRGRVWHMKRPLDAAAMHEAARVLIGHHDFSTFRDSQCQARSPLRTLDLFAVERLGDEIRFHVAARSFLHRQVRSMVGSLVEVGCGKWRAADLKAALDAADRSRCGPVAPAHGLYLAGVDYGPGFEIR